MACTPERSRLIGDFVNGRLDADASAEVLDHVEECAACSEELDVNAKLVAAAERHGSRLFRPPTPSLDWRVPVAIAATLLVPILLG